VLVFEDERRTHQFATCCEYNFDKLLLLCHPTFPLSSPEPNRGEQCVDGQDYSRNVSPCAEWLLLLGVIAASTADVTEAVILRRSAVENNMDHNILITISLCEYGNCGHYPSSCHLLKTRRFGDSMLSPPSKKQTQTPWPLVRERTIPTDRPPLVDEI
jgi:hypothetical protein